MKTVGLIIAKKDSSRLINKNWRDFCGKPMFVWNLEKCLKIFDEVYISSDYDFILAESEKLGAIPIKRPEELCKGDVVNIPVYQHAFKYMDNPDIIVTVKADSPTIDIKIIKRAKELMENHRYSEFMTAYPIKGYQDVNRVYGSVWALTKKRLEEYSDSMNPEPEILIVDKAIDIHDEEDLAEATKQMSID